ncbi:MAG: nitrate ABC transporter substrate-binding protein [Proteobacteria bacterium SG_bin9]|nr:MAG: nitrate ABC transporter substrate-binding protein [Proteobacteria bacterium SG_bin9]
MRIFAAVTALLIFVAGLGTEACRAATTLRLTYDRPIDATATPFLLAAGKGFFSGEGLSVTTEVARSTRDAISRVAAGDTDMAIADINALARFRDADNGAPLKAVFVLFNHAPYAVIARKSRGVNALADVQGRILGVPDGDLSIPFWPAVAKLNGIKPEKVKVEKIGLAVREPMLSAGQVDAVTGFSYLAPLNMRDRGIPDSDLAVFRLSDYGSEAYGAALIVNPKFAAAQPDAVRGFIRAVIAGLKLTAEDPERAINDVLTQIDSGNRELEFERLRLVLRDNLVTRDVKRDGFGSIDAKRFARALAQLGEDYKFKKTLTAADLFDPSFLPPPAARKLD